MQMKMGQNLLEMVVKWRTCVRIICLGLFIYCSVIISWQSLVALLLLIASIFKLQPLDADNDGHKMTTNPLRGKRSSKESEIPEEVVNKLKHDIYEHLTYDAESSSAIDEFQKVQQNTECIFAKKAKVWGGPDWRNDLSLEENIYRSIPTLMKFIQCCDVLGLDGFVYALPGSPYAEDVQAFGRTVRGLLTVLSNNDPGHTNSMDKSYISHTGWVFEFYRHTFFITTFAPFYSEGHSRYNFGSDSCFVLLQPELSFAMHDLSDDTPHTQWNNPKTSRDRIRIAYRDAGRPYHIRDTVIYPMAHDIIKPLVDDGNNIIKWWQK